MKKLITTMCDNFGELEHEMRNHTCPRKIFMPADKPEQLLLGFVCAGCNGIFYVSLDNVREDIYANKNIAYLETAEGRLAFAQKMAE